MPAAESARTARSTSPAPRQGGCGHHQGERAQRVALEGVEVRPAQRGEDHAGGKDPVARREAAQSEHGPAPDEEDPRTCKAVPKWWWSTPLASWTRVVAGSESPPWSPALVWTRRGSKKFDTASSDHTKKAAIPARERPPPPPIPAAAGCSTGPSAATPRWRSQHQDHAERPGEPCGDAEDGRPHQAGAAPPRRCQRKHATTEEEQRRSA